MKIRIYPNRNQKTFFQKCFGATRYIYNKSVELVKNNYKKIQQIYTNKSSTGCCFKSNDKYCNSKIDESNKFFCNKHINAKINYDFVVSLPNIRSKIMKSDSELKTNDKYVDEKWLIDIPYDTRQLAIKEFVGAHKSAISNCKNNNITYFDMSFKSRKNPTQIFHIDKGAITKDLNIFKKRKIGKLRVRTKMQKWMKNNIQSIDHDCKIIKYQDNSYYLLLSIKDNLINQHAPFNSVAIDPGSKTFVTIYSPDGIAGHLGHEFVDNKIYPITKKIDTLNKVKAKLKGFKFAKTRRKINRRQSRLRIKIKNVVDNFHNQVASFLALNFKTIILPKFDSQNMTGKLNRKITSKSVVKLLSLSHGKFRMKLINQLRRYGRKLLLVTEENTTKMCTNCGSENNVGIKRTINCQNCKLAIDRDINGARNILIKTCTELLKQ